MRGNPNPSPKTRFGAEKANPGSPGGKTSKQRKSELRSAGMAAEIREKMISAMAEKIKRKDAEPLDFLDAATLKLLKDSEDRAHGTPAQTTDITSDGDKISMPTQISLVAASDNSDD